MKRSRPKKLTYVTDDRPGIHRVRRGKSFVYRSANGRVVRDKKTLSRIRSLVLPPAWENVWISPSPRAHLQATGRDQRGRKQYRYHPEWTKHAEQTKYERILEFGRALPKIRRRINADINRRGLDRRKVLATVVKLLEVSLIRIGNEEYARSNGSFGLTTLQDRHAKIRGKQIQFKFRGKSKKDHCVSVDDPKLAKIVKGCQDLPGEELFQYLDDDGNVCDVKSQDVNNYLHSVAGDSFSAKDFRTWAATVLAAMALQEIQNFDSQAEAKRNVTKAVESVAKQLGNTPSICRKCYVHPMILTSYIDGTLLKTLEAKTRQRLSKSLRGLRPDEAMVYAFLEKRLSQELRSRRRKSRRAEGQ